MSKSPLRRVLCQDRGQLDEEGGGGWSGVGREIIPERRRGGTAERDRMKAGREEEEEEEETVRI